MEGRCSSSEQVPSELEQLRERVAELESVMAKLVHAEERHRILLENSFVGIGLSEGNRILYANRPLLQLFGYTDPEEFTAKPLIDHVAPSSRPMILERLRSVSAGIPLDPIFVYDIVRKDGGTRTVEIYVVPYSWNEKPCRLSLFRDITERKQADEALRESESKYRALVETTGTGYVIIDAEGRVLDANPEYVRLTGHNTLQDILQHRVTDWTARHDRQRNAEGVRQCAEQGYIRNFLIDYVNSQGQFTPIEVNATVLPTTEGIKILTLCRDMTERQRLESQFRQAQKMEAVGVLAGGVAHDFNNLVTVITGYSDVLLRELAHDDPKRDEVEQIRLAGERAASLTAQLLAFSRRQILEAQNLDLNAVISGMNQILHRLIGEDIELAFVAQPGVGLIRADPGQIQQIVMNLAVNARDAMPHGGKLTIQTADADLDGSHLTDIAPVFAGPSVMLAISDTGVGMDEETQSRIFEPFFTTKDPGKGTGLGLSTVYGIVNRSGGFIWVTSTPGSGTTFKIYFPRVRGEAEPLPNNRNGETGRRGIETVLLVEDEASLRTLAGRLLHDQGYTVLQAPDGNEALRIAREFAGKIHLMVTDIVMPGMGGVTLASRIRAERPDIKVLFISGYPQNATGRHPGLDGGDEFLAKPFTADALARKAREAIESTA